MKKYLWLGNFMFVRILIYLLFSISIGGVYYFVSSNIFIALLVSLCIFLILLAIIEIIFYLSNKKKKDDYEMYEFILKYHDECILENKEFEENEKFSKKLNELIKQYKNDQIKMLDKVKLYFSSNIFNEFYELVNSKKDMTIYISSLCLKFEDLKEENNKLINQIKMDNVKLIFRESVLYTTLMIVLIIIKAVKEECLEELIIKILVYIPIIVTFIDLVLTNINKFVDIRRKYDKKEKN